jgi:hypothetical protein
MPAGLNALPRKNSFKLYKDMKLNTWNIIAGDTCFHVLAPIMMFLLAVNSQHLGHDEAKKASRS